MILVYWRHGGNSHRRVQPTIIPPTSLLNLDYFLPWAWSISMLSMKHLYVKKLPAIIPRSTSIPHQICFIDEVAGDWKHLFKLCSFMAAPSEPGAPLTLMNWRKGLGQPIKNALAMWFFSFSSLCSMAVGRKSVSFIGLTDLVGPLTNPTAHRGVTRHRFDSKAASAIT